MPTARTTSTTTSSDSTTSNLVVLVGSIAGDPERRELPGGVAHEFDVATHVTGPDGVDRVRRVPVNWSDPPEAAVADLVDGIEVVVVGSVQRRFFRAGGRTQSRTEVVPTHVVPVRRRATVRRLLAELGQRLVGDA